MYGLRKRPTSTHLSQYIDPNLNSNPNNNPGLNLILAY